jgi:hypothetical protein
LIGGAAGRVQGGAIATTIHAAGPDKSSSYGRNPNRNVLRRHSHATLLIERCSSFREDQGLISQTTVG